MKKSELFLIIIFIGLYAYNTTLLTITKMELNNRLEENTFSNVEIDEVKDITYNCAYTDNVIDSTKCFNKEVKKIYKYNITKGKINFSLLKERGGDCDNYADLYMALAQREGYGTQKIVFFPNESQGHAMALLYEPGKWCLADQTNYYCGRYI